MLISISVDAFRGGQQDVGFKDVALVCGVFSLCSSFSRFPRKARSRVFSSCSFRRSRHLHSNQQNPCKINIYSVYIRIQPLGFITFNCNILHYSREFLQNLSTFYSISILSKNITNSVFTSMLVYPLLL